MKDMKKKCCHKNCLTQELTKEEVKRHRKRFWKKDEERQRSYLLQYFEVCPRRDDGTIQFLLGDTGKAICRKAWLTALRVSNGR